MILPFCHHCLQHAVIVTIKWHHWVVEFVFQSSITSYTLKHISYTIIFTKRLLHVLIHDFRLSHVLQLSMNDIYNTICIKSLYIIYLFFYCNLNEMTTHSSSFNGVPHVLPPLPLDPFKLYVILGFCTLWNSPTIITQSLPLDLTIPYKRWFHNSQCTWPTAFSYFNPYKLRLCTPLLACLMVGNHEKLNSTKNSSSSTL